MNDGLPTSIAVLGATGSVGTQSLDVARTLGIPVRLLTANADVGTMEALAREFMPPVLCMADENAAKELRTRLADTDIRVLGGAPSIPQAIGECDAEVFVNAILGEAGLLPTLAVLDTGRRLALSNKESLVVAGDIVMARAKEKGAELIPVDSEHSAIFQSLLAGGHGEIRSILLTASGGPFYGRSYQELEGVTKQDTLAHPTWKMGAKITVDSATMMNKGFEVIEACHLFGVAPDMVDVLVHRESIIHSAVEYIDGAVIAEMSLPDMRMCVQYALSYPRRVSGPCRRLSLKDVGVLHFDHPDGEAFPLLPLAYRAMKAGGAAPAVLNAANEVAVAAFLDERLSFTGIMQLVQDTAEALFASASSARTLEEILCFDKEARRVAEKGLGRYLKGKR